MRSLTCPSELISHCFICRWRGDRCDRWRCRHCYTSRRHGLGCKDQKYLKKILSSSLLHAGGLFGYVFQLAASYFGTEVLTWWQMPRWWPKPLKPWAQKKPSQAGQRGKLNCDSGNSGNSGDSGDLLFSCPRSCCLWRHLCLRYSMVGPALDGKNQGRWACLKLRTVWFVSTKGTFCGLHQ